MRHILLIVLSGAFCASAAAQTPSPSPTPFPDGAFWIGRNEIPWTFPKDVPISENISPTNLPTIAFSSPLVVNILNEIGISFVSLPNNQLQVTGWKTVVYPPNTTPKERKSWKVALQFMLSNLDLLQSNLTTIQTLSISDQLAIVTAVLDSWKQFYDAVGDEGSVPSESHLGKIREKLISEANKTGVTLALLEKCQDFQNQIQSKKTP